MVFLQNWASFTLATGSFSSQRADLATLALSYPELGLLMLKHITLQKQSLNKIDITHKTCFIFKPGCALVGFCVDYPSTISTLTAL